MDNETVSKEQQISRHEIEKECIEFIASYFEAKHRHHAKRATMNGRKPSQTNAKIAKEIREVFKPTPLPEPTTQSDLNATNTEQV